MRARSLYSPKTFMIGSGISALGLGILYGANREESQSELTNVRVATRATKLAERCAQLHQRSSRTC